MPDILCHLVTRSDWARDCRDGWYAPPSLESEGFIHLSTPEQVPATVERWYPDVPDLTVVQIDATALGDALRWDDVGHGVFPHLYGPLDLRLVTGPYALDEAPALRAAPAADDHSE